MRVPRSIEFYAELPENRVHFEVETKPGDESTLVGFSLPKLQFINPTSKAAKKLADAAKIDVNDSEAFAAVVRDTVTFIDPAVGKIVAKLKDDQVAYIEHTWIQGSTVTVPESSASSSSSKSTAGPSKRTSSTKATGSGTSAKRTSRTQTSSS